MTRFVYSSLMPVSPEELFEFHMNAENLAAISPPFPPMRIDAPPGRPNVGDRQSIRLGWDWLSTRWVARIERVVPGRLLEDTQEGGPFRKWRHQHRAAPAPGGSRLTDVVWFRLFPTAAGEFLEYWTVRPLLIAMFAYRHRRTRELVSHAK